MVLRTIWASLVTTAACLLCSLFLHALEPLCWVKYHKPPPAVSSISVAQRSHTTACFEESGCLVILSWIFDPSESLWVTNWGSEGWDMVMVFEYKTLIIFIDEDMHNLCTTNMSWAWLGAYLWSPNRDLYYGSCIDLLLHSIYDSLPHFKHVQWYIYIYYMCSTYLD